MEWDEFTFQSPYCLVDTYELASCEGPFKDATDDLTDPSNLLAYGQTGPNPSMNSLCSNAFANNYNKHVRRINEQFITNGFTNQHEGEYKVTIRGYNSVYNPTDFPGNEMLVDFIWKLKANCDDPTTVISGPTTVYSDPSLTSTAHPNADFFRAYQTPPVSGSMEVYYGVRTTEEVYSLTANNYDVVSGSHDK